MAENTFTVDTSPQTETVTDNLTTDEQDSLAVGEKIVEQQEQLLAGKYKDARELEKAYMELQTKLGEQGAKDTEQVSAEDEQPEETKLSDGATLITDAQKEYYDNGNKLSDETLAKFSEMSSSELLQAYIELNQDAPEQAEAADICYVNYGVTFPMIAQSSVRGKKANKIFSELAVHVGSPSWNFNKYLVKKDGEVTARFGSRTEPSNPKFTSAIESLLR